MFSKVLVPLVASLLLGGVGLAQTGGEGKGKPRGWLRILPVGEAPPFRQEIGDGVRSEMAPPPGSIPPRLVEIAGLGEGESESLRLSLGAPSEPVVVVAGTLPLREIDGGGAVQPEAWHQLKIPRQAAVLAVLWRDPEEKKWTKARSLVLADDTGAFAPGRLRLVNVSTYKVGVRFAGEDILLTPGRSVARGRAREALKEVPLQVAVGDKNGNWLPIFDSAVSHAASERTNVVIFRADGARPRRPAKALVIRERATFPKLPKRDSP